MKSTKLLLVALMLSLPVTLSVAQAAKDTTQVRDVFILRPGGSFINITDSTYYAIPRYRVERLLADGILADSLKAMWKRSDEERNKEAGMLESQKGFWKTVSIVAVVTAAVELLIIVIGR